MSLSWMACVAPASRPRCIARMRAIRPCQATTVLVTPSTCAFTIKLGLLCCKKLPLLLSGALSMFWLLFVVLRMAASFLVIQTITIFLFAPARSISELCLTHSKSNMSAYFLHQLPFPPGARFFVARLAEAWRAVALVDAGGNYLALHSEDGRCAIAGGLLGLPYAGDLVPAGTRGVFAAPAQPVLLISYLLVATRSEDLPTVLELMPGGIILSVAVAVGVDRVGGSGILLGVAVEVGVGVKGSYTYSADCHILLPANVRADDCQAYGLNLAQSVFVPGQIFKGLTAYPGYTFPLE